MADLPRDIGFDDDPVVLISYVMIEDPSSKFFLVCSGCGHKCAVSVIIFV